MEEATLKSDFPLKKEITRIKDVPYYYFSSSFKNKQVVSNLLIFFLSLVLFTSVLATLKVKLPTHKSLLAI